MRRFLDRLRYWALRGTLVVFVLAASGFAVRPDVGRFVWWSLTKHTGAPEVTWALEPLADDPPAVRIAIAGDVGTGGEEAWQTAAAMDGLEDDVAYDALVLLGDNVYPNGDPARLDAAVFDPFAGVLDGRTRLLPVLGNHDVEDGHGDAHAARIGMPARWYATQLGDVLIVSLDSTRAAEEAQQQWLEHVLAATDARWRIATMHHPPYSGGYHGSDDDARDAFVPILRRHGVQLVFAGHDHDYQRNDPGDGITYVVSGGAAKLRAAGGADFTDATWSTHHFVDLAVWSDHIELRAIDQHGRVFDIWRSE